MWSVTNTAEPSDRAKINGRFLIPMVREDKRCLESRFGPPKPHFHQLRRPICQITSQSALPNGANTPTLFQQRLRVPTVSSNVPSKLFLPKFSPCIRISCTSTTCMPMPEASMNETDRPKPLERDIRRPVERLDMYAIPQPTRVKRAAQRHFRLCILPRDECHHASSS